MVTANSATTFSPDIYTYIGGWRSDGLAGIVELDGASTGSHVRHVGGFRLLTRFRMHFISRIVAEQIPEVVLTLFPIAKFALSHLFKQQW